MSLSLKIDNQFIALPDSTEISIEASNPIFSDAGAKTYLFEIPVESLRYIIGNADEIYGESLYDVLEGKRAEIYIDGVQFFSGVVNLEDEISIEDGKIAVSIASGNLELAQMIDGMNCRDVELKDDIEIGWVYDSAKVNFKVNPEMKSYVESLRGEIIGGDKDLEFFFPDNYVAITNTNLQASYKDGAKFCNIRRAFSTQNTAIADNYIKSHEQGGSPRIKLKESGGDESVISLEYNSMRSAPCFYVLYFLDCLFQKLGLVVGSNGLESMEDANRLAFVNTNCSITRVGSVEEVTIDEENKPYPGFGRTYENPEFWAFRDGPHHDCFVIERMRLLRQKAIASSDNFPDKPVSDIVEAIQNLFNVRIFNSDKEVRIVSVPEILKSIDINTINAEIYEAHKIENRTLGFRLSYSSSEDDTNFNFDRYSNVKPIDQYGKALVDITPNNPTVYVDVRNGNAYAVKVSQEAVDNGSEEELNPVLFEVAGFSPATYGNCEDESYIEEVKLNFSPIINNDINGYSNTKKAETSNLNSVDGSLENMFALLVDVGNDPIWTTITLKNKLSLDGYYIQGNRRTKDVEGTFTIAYYDYNPEEKIESDFMLGIMRGPGSDAKPETFAQNFDGEGNYRVVFTAANYAFTSDSIDNCDRNFDYNGTAEGVGPDELKGRFSLKLRAGKYDKDGNPIKDADGKPIVIQDKERAERGLYDKFWKEYAYFTVNKKIIHLTCGMEIADIVNLDWTKRYKIGEWTGFIANYSFNVNKNGMSEVELEMYYL